MELISKDDVIEVALSLMNDTNKNTAEQTANEVLHDVIQCVHNIPTIEERKEGEWLDNKWLGEKCSVCSWELHYINFGQFKYCPNCGARMKGE